LRSPGVEGLHKIKKGLKGRDSWRELNAGDGMRWDSSTYNDDQELTEYIWHNYSHLMTSFERMGSIGLQKFGPSKAVELRRSSKNQDDPLVIDALDQGFDAFRRQVRERIIARHAHAVFINRCPVCQRITATPKARQCLWCGHDWHNER
jgi:hypothetical protein